MSTRQSITAAGERKPGPSEPNPTHSETDLRMGTLGSKLRSLPLPSDDEDEELPASGGGRGSRGGKSGGGSGGSGGSAATSSGGGSSKNESLRASSDDVRRAGGKGGTAATTAAAAAAAAAVASPGGKARKAAVELLNLEEPSGAQSDALAELDRAMTDLDITNEEVDFDELSALVRKFQNDPRVKAVLEDVVDMREYASNVEGELQQLERDAIPDYLAESSNILTLHAQIKSCDAILEKMEGLLGGFQADLGNISSEIRFLQEESFSLSMKLRNRKQLEELTRKFIDHTAISPDLVRDICDGEVNEAYVERLSELHEKLEFVQSQSGNSSLPAFREVEPELEKLKLKAVARVRDFLLSKIYSLKKPQTNIQIIQQNLLIKFRDLFRFLSHFAEEVAHEVRDNYLQTLAKTYADLFAHYAASLLKYKVDIGARVDLLGAEEAQVKGWLSDKYARGKGSVFTLGDRGAVVADTDRPSLVLNELPTSGAGGTAPKLTYDVIYRSINSLLLDSVAAEAAFQTEFFQRADSSLVAAVFSKAFAALLEHHTRHLEKSFDIIGVLLMAAVTAQNRRLMFSRKVTAIGGYLESVQTLIWARFKALLDLHVDSLRTVSVKSIAAQIDTKPHYITRRYANLITALQAIPYLTMASGGGPVPTSASASSVMSRSTSGGGGGAIASSSMSSVAGGATASAASTTTTSSASATTTTAAATAAPPLVPATAPAPSASLLFADDNRLQGELTLLRSQVEGLLARMSVELQDKMKRTVFIINNYDLVMTTLAAGGAGHSPDMQRFQELSGTQIAVFVEEELIARMGRLVAFVKDVEPRLAVNPTVDRAQLETLVRDFSASYKDVVTQINADIMTYFPNFVAGTQVLTEVWKQLMRYYASFEEIVKANLKTPASSGFVASTMLAYELKKHARDF